MLNVVTFSWLNKHYLKKETNTNYFFYTFMKKNLSAFFPLCNHLIFSGTYGHVTDQMIFKSICFSLLHNKYLFKITK